MTNGAWVDGEWVYRSDLMGSSVQEIMSRNWGYCGCCDDIEDLNDDTGLCSDCHKTTRQAAEEALEAASE